MARRTAGAASTAIIATAMSALATLTGCSGIDHATLDGVAGMPDDSTLGNGSGTLHTGIAVDFTPRVWTDNTFGGTSEQTDGIDVQSSNGFVVQTAHVSSDRRVVVWAVHPGTADLTVTYNGSTALVSHVTVTDQSE
jgi:hypothetical protein